MCGICGVALSQRSRRTLDRRQLERMRDQLTHRGPDDEGVFVDGRVGLGHRRLSIIDISGGHQPMSSDDGSLHIVYNGEVYNHLSLRAELERAGHRYRTNCDTETVLRLFEQRGATAAEHLRGMFAFAIWNQRSGELFLVRDRLGIKPLYYTVVDDGSLYFASEIKALLEAGAVQPALNGDVLPDYLANRSPSGAETLFRGVTRLLPGQILRWRDGEIDVRTYWDVSFAARQEPGRAEADLIDEFRERFRESVDLRLMSDVPLGLFLSGGIDSASIAAMMSGLVNEPIKTFSVGFVEREASELSYARLASRAFGTDHHEVVLSPDAFFDALPNLVWHEDEPLAHPSSVALYFVSELAAKHVKVVLTGEGSDELLAGYARYAKTAYNIALGESYRALTGARFRRTVCSLIDGLDVRSRVRQKLIRSFFYLEPELESIYFDNFSVFTRRAQTELLAPEMKERLNGIDPYATQRHWLESSGTKETLDRLLYVDIKTYLHELLMKQDQMSMAASIESRVPFLDHVLVEFVAGLPLDLRLRGWTTKYVLRKSLKGVVPKPILRRRKMGFPVPLGSWLRGRFRWVLEEYVVSERAMARGMFSPGYVRRLVAEHLAGHVDHTERLWALINFEIWNRLFIDKEQTLAAQADIAAAAIGKARAVR